ncbi:hypothetical protein B4099_3188 [Heyndrickxia coagulans]|uniref:Uncharacterized protein n=1 Tax=Heyndrickxia coagulans TaxID=1398 RepID=A0A150KI63_HEYCO|nr:hypothetical protein B4099_3188 [Heyndrickxia coagulans]
MTGMADIMVQFAGSDQHARQTTAAMCKVRLPQSYHERLL